MSTFDERAAQDRTGPGLDQHGGLPIKLGPVSNGEFLPRPATPLVRETVRRTQQEAERVSARLGMSRRRFLSTLSGSALTLATLSACSSEQNAASTTSAAPTSGGPPTTGPGGTFSIPETAITEPEAAAEVLAGEEFVFDVQGHLLDYDLDVPIDQEPVWFGGLFPQAGCGEDDPRACFAIEAFLDLMFLQSDTSALVLSALPIQQAFNPMSHEVMAEAKRIAAGVCADRRVLAQGGVLPGAGELPEVIDAMVALKDEFEVAAWKVYTHQPGNATFWLDDHEDGVQKVGTAFLDKVTEIGPNIVSIHKGLRVLGGEDAARFADPVDIGPAADRYRDIDFVVYHSGYETDRVEGVYDPNANPAVADGTVSGIDRLLLSMQANDVAPGANVYAELGSTWRNLMSKPTDAAHALGKLLLHVGEDNIVWGTDSIWYGSPQDQIQAFRAFEITEEFQEGFGYPALTAERKAKILGLNGARLYGIEPDKVPCPFTREDLQAARQEVALAPRSFGPETISQVYAHIDAHNGAA